MKTVTLRYSEPLVRAAVRTFVWRAIRRGFGLRFFVLLAAMAAFVVYLWAQGERGWLLGALASTLVFAGVTLVAIYVAHYRNTVGRFRQMRVPEAQFSYDEEHFTITSDLGSYTLPWSAIVEIWRYPLFWLILFSPGQFSTLPLDGLDAETQAFITRKTPVPSRR